MSDINCKHVYFVSDITMNQEEAAETTGETYAEKEAKEEAEKAETASSIVVLIPSALKLIDVSKVHDQLIRRNFINCEELKIANFQMIS